MRNILLLFCLLSIVSTFQTFAQEQEDSITAILDTPKNWRSELIKFPLGFAPSIDYEGVEDIRFAEGWADKSSEQFWTYAFIWSLDKNPKLTEKSLRDNMEVYFDGLMQAVGKGKGLKPEEINKTLALFQKAAYTTSDFIGKILIYDAFFLQDQITLNLKVKSNYCQKTEKYHALFYIAPKDLEDDFWEIFKEVKVGSSCN